ncbi:MAG TPA: transcriptional activator NhaR [Gammaproteobacteria bacterium]|nr:transcriptional activator NhaR [Gammaproteobacteria bacterium]
MRGLNYNHLFYFWTVAKEGGIAAASQALYLTPQTISAQLRALEESLGAKLFTRVGRRLVLTDTGQVTYRYADEMFRLGAEMTDVLEGRVSGQPLTFTVGIVDVVPKLIAYRLLEPALGLEEPVHIVCREGKLETLLADIALHKLDIVLADTPMGTGVNVRAFNHLLGECGVSFFAARSLAQRYRRRFPRSLADAPMLLPATNTAVRGALMQWLDQQGIRPHIVGEFEDSALMNAFGERAVGMFVAPTVIEREITRQYAVRIIGRTDEVRERFYAISAERRLRHPAVVAVSQAARSKLFETGQ